jgi:hypothetical protein
MGSMVVTASMVLTALTASMALTVKTAVMESRASADRREVVDYLAIQARMGLLVPGGCQERTVVMGSTESTEPLGPSELQDQPDQPEVTARTEVTVSEELPEPQVRPEPRGPREQQAHREALLSGLQAQSDRLGLQGRSEVLALQALIRKYLGRKDQ